MSRVLIALTVLGALSVGAAAATKQHKVTQCRDVKTGTYVTAAYAKKYPGLTVCERHK